MTWTDTLEYNGVMQSESNVAQALATGISEKTALSGSTTSVDISGMCLSLFEAIDWGFCDSVDQVLCVLGPRFMDENNSFYSSNISELISDAGFSTAVYGATNGEVVLKGGGVLFGSEWVEQRKGILNLFVRAATEVTGATFTKTSLNSEDWLYSDDNVIAGTTVSLPHSADAFSTPIASVYGGTATYTLNATLNAARRYYLYLEPAYQRADVALSGHVVSGGSDALVTGHTYTTECPGLPVVIDLTSIPFSNGSNAITITTDSTITYWYIPHHGNLNIFNMLGGVTLCEAGKLCFDPLAYGTRRCHLSTSQTTLTAKVKVKSNSNQTASDTCTVTAEVWVTGATAAEVTGTTTATVAPGASTEVTFELSVPSSSTNKWDIGSGNLYEVRFTLLQDNTPYDSVTDHVGFRSFSASKYTSSNDQYGFTLNGTGRSLYGISYQHFDRIPTADEYDEDWAYISALKPQMIRFAYFPAIHYLLDKCDEAGIVALVEIPWMHNFMDGEWPAGNTEVYRNDWRKRYQYNVTANAVAMIKELYNHPSVLFYCIGTGFGDGTSGSSFLADQAHAYITDELLPAVRAADSSRLVCIELATNTAAAWTDVADIIMEKMRYGWNEGSISNAASEANTWNGRNNTTPFAIHSYAYGANPSSHVEWSEVSGAKPSNVNDSTSVFPEEYQAYCVEQYTGSVLALKWPVFNLYGAMFDFGVASINAGGKEHVCQLGLVTRDRSVVKDAYYYLKSLWNAEPMVYVTQKRNMEKETDTIQLRIYTNCAYVKVYSASMTLLDTIQTSGSHAVTTTTLTLEEGSNIFYVTGHATSSGTSTCSDSVTVLYEDTSGTVHVVVYSDSAIVNSGVVAAKILPSTEVQGVTWTSLDPTVATIDGNGTVTVVSAGTASIRATSLNDSSVSRTKSIPCFIKGDTESLYYKAALDAPFGFYDTGGGTYSDYYTQNGLTITDNRDGTFTINGTLSDSQGRTTFNLLPAEQVSINGRPGLIYIMVPPWGIPGDQLITAEVMGGTITGTTVSGEPPMTVMPIDETFALLTQCRLFPLNEVGEADGDVKAKLVTGSTFGFGGFSVKLGYDSGTVFDNVVVKAQSFKYADTYHNAGILESHFDTPNAVKLFIRDGNDPTLVNMYARNADGSFALTYCSPNAGYAMPQYGRLTDTFTVNRNSVPVSGSTIASEGDVVKFTAVMVNWPGYYRPRTGSESVAEFAFVAWYSDGTEAAKLKWAYQEDGTGVDFTGGTASTTFIASKTIDSVGYHSYHCIWGGPLNATETIIFRLKMELLDPSLVPPESVTAYGSTRIVNSGQLNAVCSPVSASQSVSWSSSNTSVATVDSNGKVTVVADGNCTFTATSTVDNSKSGSVSVACLKETDTNMLANLAVAKDSGKSITVSGVTITNNGDGTFELDGTVSYATVTYAICPLATSGNSTYPHFLPEGFAGDVLVWFEHLSGTVSADSTFTDVVPKDFEVRIHGASNAVLADYTLNYAEYPESNGETQCKLITGSTSGIRRVDLYSKRAVGTVFSNYVFRVGVKKLFTSGVVYGGGVIESALLAMYDYAQVEKLFFNRLGDGSFWVYVDTSNANWTNRNNGCFRLTSGIATAQYRSGILTGNTIATSGKTYKFTLRWIETVPFTSGTELSFSVQGKNGTQLAKITTVSDGALSGDIDSNGVGEATFTATEDIDCVYFYFNNVVLTNPKVLHFQVKLEEVTT